MKILTVQVEERKIGTRQGGGGGGGGQFGFGLYRKGWPLGSAGELKAWVLPVVYKEQGRGAGRQDKG